jgi:nitrate/TMAO reductase-like tetraheme cytochrome c subunit
MPETNRPLPRGNLFGRLWRFVWAPSSRVSIASLLIAGGICGVLFWGGFNWGMESTNTLGFCTSCHEMRDTVYQEYTQSIHYKNRFGVRAICSDCHVPHPWVYKIKRKIEASNELYHKLLGTISTPAKFEQHRTELAQHVWDTMKSTDSRECRNCHNVSAIDIHAQSETAQKVMAPGLEAGLTCIDCHKGIAHHLPKTEEDDPKGEPAADQPAIQNEPAKPNQQPQ